MCRSELSTGNRYLLLDNGVDHIVSSEDNMMYTVLFNDKDDNDNISCLGQCIEIPLIQAKYIAF